MHSSHDILCLCGREQRVKCKRCGRYARTANDKIIPHEIGICMGSHMNYVQCSG
jgi:hypothetical protein